MSVDLLCSLDSNACMVEVDHDCIVLLMDAESEVKREKSRMVSNGTMRVMPADLLYNLKDMQVPNFRVHCTLVYIICHQK